MLDQTGTNKYKHILQTSNNAKSRLSQGRTELYVHSHGGKHVILHHSQLQEAIESQDLEAEVSAEKIVCLVSMGVACNLTKCAVPLQRKTIVHCRGSQSIVSSHSHADPLE